MLEGPSWRPTGNRVSDVNNGVDDEEEEDDEDEYPLASIYNGPRPDHVPKAVAFPFGNACSDFIAQLMPQKPLFVPVSPTLTDLLVKDTPNGVALDPVLIPATVEAKPPQDSMKVASEQSDAQFGRASPTAASEQSSQSDPPFNRASPLPAPEKSQSNAQFDGASVLAAPEKSDDDNDDEGDNVSFSETNIRNGDQILMNGNPSEMQSLSVHSSNISPNRTSTGSTEDQVNLDGNFSTNLIRAKGECHRCRKISRMEEKETCLVCSAKYCAACVIKSMGSMPEGRKCTKCVGFPILESRRPNIGKPSRLLTRLVSTLEVQQIMKAETECNILKPEQLWVNGVQLNNQEYLDLLQCNNPPLSVNAGRYWYDDECGYWGKEGHRPEQIITAHLKFRGKLMANASKGNTEIFINGREITKVELKLLKLAGLYCPPKTSFWVDKDGKCQEEGHQNRLSRNIWNKGISKYLYPLISLRPPNSNTSELKPSVQIPAFLDQKKTFEILLMGPEGSGKSTIFKQARLLYGEELSPKELHNIRSLIQNNILKYIIILLEACERFDEEEKAAKMNEPSSSSSGPTERPNVYTIDPKLRQKVEAFIDDVETGYADSRSGQYTPLIEQIWKDPAIQATFMRKEEIPMMPDDVDYFLDKAVQISSINYSLSDHDILFAEESTRGLSFSDIELTLNESNVLSGPYNEKLEQPFTGASYHLIMVNSDGLYDGCKWFEMLDLVHTLVYCVPLDAYDQVYPIGDTFQNKIIQSREILESILRHPPFQGIPIIILFTNVDQFKDKVNKVPLTRCEWFSDFNPVPSTRRDPHLFSDQAYTYIAHKFKKHFKTVNVNCSEVYTDKVNAWDQSGVARAFDYVKEVLKWQENKLVFRSKGIYSVSQFSSYSSVNMSIIGRHIC